MNTRLWRNKQGQLVLDTLIPNPRHTVDAIQIWIPKTAGWSIHDVLKKHRNIKVGVQRLLWVQDRGYFKGVNFPPQPLIKEGLWNFKHCSIVDMIDVVIDRSFFEKAWKFCFVRNPWDRTVSLWHHRSQRYHFNLSFEEFVQTIPSAPPVDYWGKRESRINPQVDWITKDGHCFADFVGRFESLERDAKIVFDKLGIKAELPHVNATDHNHYTEYYTSKTKDLVADIYRQDIEMFEYEFGK